MNEEPSNETVIREHGHGKDCVMVKKVKNIEDNLHSADILGINRVVNIKDYGIGIDKLELKITKDNIKKNWYLLFIVGSITVITPFFTSPPIMDTFIGLYLFSGWKGVIMSLASNIVSLVLGFYAIIQIIEIEIRTEI